MASSDYLDYLDIGVEPPPGSENWVAPFIQEVFDEEIKERKPDLARTIKEHTAMQLN